MKTFIYPIIFCGVALMASLQANAQDVASYYIQKEVDYNQSSATSVTLDPVSPYQFFCNINPGTSGALFTGATSLTPPTGSMGTVSFMTGANDNFDGSSSPNGLYFSANFTNKAALDAAFPSGTGTYNFAIQTTTPKTYSDQVSFGADNYPANPQITNVTNATWSGGYLVVTDITQPVTITWNNPVGTSSGWFGIWGSSESYPSTPTSVTLPANSLSNNAFYTASIFWFLGGGTGSTDSGTIPGAYGGASFLTQVLFTIQTGTPTGQKTYYSVEKFHILSQTANSAPVDATGDANDWYSGGDYAPYSLWIISHVSGTVTGPQSTSFPLACEPDNGNINQGDFEYLSGSMASQAALDAAYPDGTYTFPGGTQVSLTGDAYPAAPQILSVNGGTPVWNAQGQLVLDPTIGNTITWSSVTVPNFATNGYEEADFFTLGSSDFNSITLKAGVTRSSITPFTTLTVPANSMTPGNTYRSYVVYASAPTFNNPIANVYDVADYKTVTEFYATAIPPYSTSSDGSGGLIVTAYTGTGGAVVIPSTINGLTVTSIGADAFENCTNLTSVTIPSGVTSIGVDAFYGCTNLTSVTVPPGVTSIGADAFEDCTNLTSMTIPSSIAIIGGGAFANCSRLTSITVSAQNTTFSSVGGVLFNLNQTSLLQYPGGLAGSYTIPSSVTSIGPFAFDGCTGLTSVTIPASVTSIATGIGNSGFTGCTSLSSITVSAQNTSYSSVGGVLFNLNLTTLLQYPGGLAGSYTVPSSVTSIGADAFQDCPTLTSVTIPAGVTSIGGGTFAICSKLTSITVSAQNTSYSSVGGVFFNQNQTTLLQYPGGLAGSYTIPSSVTSIGALAFYGCTGLTSVRIPNGVTSIGPKGFTDCTSLTSVTIPASLSSIGAFAFGSCSSLTSAIFMGNAPTMTVGAVGMGVFGSTASGFTVYYYNGATGFASPTWAPSTGNSYTAVDLYPSLYFQSGTSLGMLSLNTTFLPNAWQGVGAMGSGWQERAIGDITGHGIPSIVFQNGTLIGALIMNANGTPNSWVGIGAMNAGWELCGAADITDDGNLDLIFQNGTLLGFLEINSTGQPVSWTGIGAMSAGWELRAVASIDGTGQPDLIFQNGTLLGALKVNTSGLPTAWVGIGGMGSGWTLSDAVDVNGDGQPDLIFQNGTTLGALQVNTSLQPVAWNGIGAMGSGWTLPGDY